MNLLQPVLVDAILALVLIEGVILVGLRRAGRRVPSVAQTVTFLGAGAALLLAVRAVLAGWPTVVALGALAVAGLSHAAHVALDSTGRAAGRNS
jgi:hypothetical protein